MKIFFSKEGIITAKKLIIYLAFILVISGCTYAQEKYPSGRDTVLSFGDGTLQLQRSGSTNLMILYDFSKAPSSSVIDTIKAYKKKNHAAYLIGVKYFIFIDTAQNTFTLYEGLDHVPARMRAEFESLK